MNNISNGAAKESIQPFQFKSVKDIYDAPQEEVKYCVEGLLPSSGLSVLAGKPKAGKTTLARQLAVAVAQGHSFLNRVTQQGAVLYLAIEEKQSEVAAHFQELGLCESDPVHIHCGAVPKHQAVAMLEATLMNVQGATLVIIDPIFRFVGVRDSNDYVEVGNALEQLLELARKYAVHILTVHHMKKRETEDVMDGALGSTAIVGGSDSFLALKADAAGIRTLCTRQRYGKDMEPTQLDWNPDTRELSLGVTCEEAERLEAGKTRHRIENDMMQYVREHPHCIQQAILNVVRGKLGTKKRVLQSLRDEGLLVQSGEGAKGNPYTYTIATVPTELGLENTLPIPIIGGGS
jgi:archaellum biogenesis ATPase FlaH